MIIKRLKKDIKILYYATREKKNTIFTEVTVLFVPLK